MKILLVEDARAVVKVMTERLHRYGHEVVHAANGKIAVEMFFRVAPDLVLMDIEMPVMNGFEATHQIRQGETAQQWAWTPIIFLTSSDTAQNLVTAIEAGGDDFMSKYVPEPVLQARLKALARIAALRQRLLAANVQLQELADRDGLTGLSNRRSLDERTDALWDRMQALQRPFGLLMLDIDHFKKFNDAYGHLHGDDCLRAVARALAAEVDTLRHPGISADAFCARYGGEEFCVVLPDTQDAACRELAEAIVAAVAALNLPHIGNPGQGRVTVSIGCYWLDRAGGTLGHLFREADACLYRAKEGGRNRVVAAHGGTVELQPQPAEPAVLARVAS